MTTINELDIKKKELEKLIENEYYRMEVFSKRSKKKFVELYENYDFSGLIDFEISDVGFYFGDIFTSFDSKNYDLCDRLYKYSNYVNNIDAVDLSESKLTEMVELLIEVYNENFFKKFTPLTTNMGISELLKVIETISLKYKELSENDNTYHSLAKAICALYIYLDFSLNDSEDKELALLRKLHQAHIKTQSECYDNISAYKNEIYKIDDEIENIYFKEEELERTTSINNSITFENNLETITELNQTNEKEEKTSIKDYLTFTSGILYYIVSLFVSILPFVMIGANFFVNLLLIGINMFFPLSSIIFWIWGLICAINGVQDVWAIIYYILFVIIWIPFYISIIIDTIKSFKK